LLIDSGISRLELFRPTAVTFKCRSDNNRAQSGTTVQESVLSRTLVHWTGRAIYFRNFLKISAKSRFVVDRPFKY